MDISDSMKQEEIARVFMHCKTLYKNKMAIRARCMKIELRIALAVKVVKKCTIATG